jgi:sugar phosphate isomerase/epimerase
VEFVASAGCIHLKDLDRSLLGRDFWESVQNGAFVPLGRGCVDLRALLTAAGDFAGWWVVEQDRAAGAGDPVADLRESRRYLEELVA